MHAQPNCEQQVDEGACIRQEEEREEEGRRGTLHAPFAEEDDAKLQKERSHEMINIHATHRELDEIADVLAEKLEAFHLHLQS